MVRYSSHNCKPGPTILPIRSLVQERSPRLAALDYRVWFGACHEDVVMLRNETVSFVILKQNSFHLKFVMFLAAFHIRSILRKKKRELQ